MNRREYRTIDKSGWDAGPWQDEPDKVSWVDDETDLPCLIVRGPSSLCGYVGVPEGHPWFEVHPWFDLEVDVHGGLTYADHCDKDAPEESGICHIPAPGEPDRVWWLGFDTAHHMDLTFYSYGGKFVDRDRYPGEVYRDLAYVTAEVESLAQQAHSAKHKQPSR